MHELHTVQFLEAHILFDSVIEAHCDAHEGRQFLSETQQNGAILFVNHCSCSLLQSSLPPQWTLH